RARDRAARVRRGPRRLDRDRPPERVCLARIDRRGRRAAAADLVAASRRPCRGLADGGTVRPGDLVSPHQHPTAPRGDREPLRSQGCRAGGPVTRVAVLGAGAWGTALADLLARHDVPTILWAYEREVAEAITSRHENPLYFADRQLSPALAATASLTRALEGAELVLTVTPSHVARHVWREAAAHIPDGTPLVCATKGIEPDS